LTRKTQDVRTRCVHRNLWHQVREGGRVLDQGSWALLAFHDYPAEHWK